MTDHRHFCTPEARAALLDYREAKHPQIPHLQLYFATSGAIVMAAGRYDIDSDWYEPDDVVDEVERRLNESYVATRRTIPNYYFAEWDLKAK